MEQNMMGKMVAVTKLFERAYSGNWRKWGSHDVEQVTGWIVGFRTIYDGYVDHEWGEYGERLGTSYFVQDKSHQCALVALSPRQNAVRVPLDGFELVF